MQVLCPKMPPGTPVVKIMLVTLASKEYDDSYKDTGNKIQPYWYEPGMTLSDGRSDCLFQCKYRDGWYLRLNRA